MASKRSKILIVSGIFSPDIGGPAGYLQSVIPAMKSDGHEVVVITFSDVSEYEADQEFPAKIIRISRNQLILSREILFILKGIFYARKADIIYASGNDFKAMIVGFLTRKKRIHKVVGDVSWERAQNRSWFKGTVDEYQAAKKSFKLQILDYVRSLPLRTATKVITPSRYLKRIISGWNVQPDKIHVVYNAYNPPSEVNKNYQLPDQFNKREAIKLITVCRLVPWKGIGMLLSALREQQNLILFIVGDGPLSERLKKEAKELGVEDRAIFLGRVPRKNIPSLLENSDLFILNSSYEGLPHVVLEAMDAQTPVIASAVGGTPEVVLNKETGLTFEYNNQKDFLKCIERIQKNKKELIHGATQVLSQKFSFKNMYQQTIDLVLS